LWAWKEGEEDGRKANVAVGSSTRWTAATVVAATDAFKMDDDFIVILISKAKAKAKEVLRSSLPATTLDPIQIDDTTTTGRNR
jgi:hypothetical protein